MQNRPEFVFFNTGIDSSVCKSIFDFVNDNIEITEAKCSSNTVDKDIRNCLVGYIPRSHWINGVLDYYIRAANNDVFNFDIKNWYDDLNFLFYDGRGSGYKWHSDIDVPANDVGIRKLSIVLSLSSKEDYEGGEFQILLDGRKEMETLKFDMGDCIIFPSTAIHRVRPLKSGERTVISGWYGGPEFR